MPDGPLVALIVFAVAALAGAIYLFVEHRRHHAPHERVRRGEVGRIPLFSTDQLGARAPGEGIVRGTRAAPAEPARADGADGDLHVTATRPDGTPATADDQPSERAGRAGAPARRRDPAVARGAAPPGPAPAQSVVQREADRPPRVAPGPLAPPAVSLGALAPTPSRAAATGGEPDHGPTTATPPARHVAIRAGSADVVEGETIRFSIPGDHTLQFLPGRLEVVVGPDTGREVRFVRTSGEPLPEVTFGRSEGPAYRHVQLLARTVSRLHARMSLLDEHWQLTNLSSTNPVVLNGRPLAQDEVAPLLVDGDRIEMGEVVFLFHSR